MSIINPCFNIEQMTAKDKTDLIRQVIKSSKGILHLGAHQGQEAASYSGYNKPVVWVEAMPDIYKKLAQNIAEYSDQKALCALLGDCNGMQNTFHISNNSAGVSSSIYEFGPYANGDESLWPQLGLTMIDSITLPMLRLDSLLVANSIDCQNYNFWVVDLQGAELLALYGAGELLAKCSAMYIEVSTAEVYNGGVLWPELKEFLLKNGMMPLWEPANIHDDILFVRESKLEDVNKKFHSVDYIRHNQRRLEHLASLGLDLTDKTVLEVGAGVGDHTSFYLDRGCSVLVTEGRYDNFAQLQLRYAKEPGAIVQFLDVDAPFNLGKTFQIVHCYGLLYHLKCPAQAIQQMAGHCAGVMIIETCVSYGDDSAINPVKESEYDVTQALHGLGCRPTRRWVWERLSENFPYVYVTAYQPAHKEFPLQWTGDHVSSNDLTRSVFVASRYNLGENLNLVAYLPKMQLRN